MEKSLKYLVCKTIDEKSDELNKISQQIWKNPELKFEEHKAHDLLTLYLEKEGFLVERKTPLETSFIARYGESSGVKIGICCEYDALPGIGHACGHNLIAEAGVAAALGLKAVLMEEPEMFQLVIFGTPAEEGGGGKVKMIEKGVFNKVDLCMMSHPSPHDVLKPIFLGGTQLYVTFEGKNAHGAAAPWEGVNAVDAAVACYISIGMLRQQVNPEYRLHCIITDGGKALNVIPDTSSIKIGIRAKTADFKSINRKIFHCIEGAAKSTGCTFKIEEGMPPYESIKTNNVLIDLYEKNLLSLGANLDCIDPKDLIASTDVSQIKPSIHPLFKIKTTDVNHTRGFTEASGAAENQLPTLNSAKSMAMTAVDVVCNPKLFRNALEDFNKYKE